ncbi:MAG: hypothetical protein ACFE89_04665 [Candidatus Hodarchaeota archaeon]
MAQDIEPKIVWRHTFSIAVLMLVAFIAIDGLHFFIFGTKFTYLLNPASATAVIDFFFYLLTFAGMAFLVGFLVNFETKDVVIAGVLGPYLFLVVNGVILHILLMLNPAYATTLIPHWQWTWGPTPDWFAILDQILITYWMLYLQSFLLFTVLALPFILATSFTGHAIRVMMGWNFPG